MPKSISNADLLSLKFLDTAREFQANVELIKVLKSRTYQIGAANVLVRASSDGNNRYFFGINYITIEEIANLENPFIAFICGNVERTIIIPAKILFKELHQISHDRNGEYKINIDKDLNIVLAGKGNRLDCTLFLNNWNLLLAPPIFESEKPNSIEESLHSVLQGRLLEIEKLEVIIHFVLTNLKNLIKRNWKRFLPFKLVQSFNSQITIYFDKLMLFGLRIEVAISYQNMHLKLNYLQEFGLELEEWQL